MDVISQLLDESTPDGFSAKIKNNIAFFHDILLASKSDIEPLNDLIRELILLKKNIISAAQNYFSRPILLIGT